MRETGLAPLGDRFELDCGIGRGRVVLEVGTLPGPEAIARAQAGTHSDFKEMADGTLVWFLCRAQHTYLALGGVYLPNQLDNRAYLWLVKLGEPERCQLRNLIQIGRLFIRRLPWYTLAEVDPSSQPARGLVRTLGFKPLRELDDRIVYEVPDGA